MKPAASSALKHLPPEVDARYRAPLIAYFQRRTESRAEAEALAQELFLRLVERVDADGAEIAARSIFTIAAGLLRDQGERAGSRRANGRVDTAVAVVRRASDAVAGGGPALERPASRQAGVSEAARPAQGGWGRYLSSLMRSHRVGVAAVMLAVVVAGAAYVLGRPPQPLMYETHLGERRTVVLADASKIALDEDSRVSVAYSGRFRDLQLFKGQAEFQVAKDPLRPFSVVAGGRRVVATGTLFNVDLLDRELLVTLLRGSVVVADEPGEPGRGRVIALAPFERLIVEQSTGSARKTKVDASDAVAWQLGKIVFAQEPLDRAVARVNRYAHRKIAIKAWEHARSPISGTFDIGDVDAFARSVSAQLPIRAEQRDGVLAFVPR